MVVLVTGAGGQLAQSLEFIASDYPEIKFHFLAISDLDITKTENIDASFKALKPDFCINTAAYTAVDKAESEVDTAHLINVIGAKNLAESCKKHNATLLHISTDFVFDGDSAIPYTEKDIANPKSVYGKTKKEGEDEIIQTACQYFIIRTSWLYSQFANNFMKTMIRLGNERDSLSVVSDQIGTPTHGVDLAKVIVKVILSKSKNYGIYHYSNEGVASWYDFAKKIFELNNIEIDLKPISTSEFPTPAERPLYSVLDKTKIKSEFNITIDSWQDSLAQ